MKKKRAILLFGSLATLVLGYAAWCARPMYLSVPVPELLELPEDVREDAKAIVVRHGLAGPDSFRWDDFIELLAKPYTEHSNKIMVVPHPDSIMVYRARPGVRDHQLPVHFYRFPGTPWMLQSFHVDGVLQPARPLKTSPP
jgi:hypothetical protein